MLLSEYRDEARQQLEQLDHALLNIEQRGELADRERKALLRSLHTFKGNSGMLGFAAVRDLLHAVESVFKEERSDWPQPALDILFEAAATLRSTVERAGTEQQEDAFARAASLLPRIAVLHNTPQDTPLAKHAEDSLSPPEAAPAAETPSEPKADDESAGSARRDETATVPPEAPTTSAGEPVSHAGELVRVPFEKLDGLLNDVAELIQSVAELDALAEHHRPALDAAGVRRPLRHLIGGLERSVDAIRQSTLDLRLVPVRRVFARFPTLAREIARDEGKRVRVVLDGEDTELDKSTVDVLGEPLLHLVRNAVDHGIEPPPSREAHGKPPEGTITLRATQVGDRVRIEVEDDGRGLDRDAILRRARESGIIAPDENLPPPAVAALIFRPGFSTRSEADSVSGRGIGMDVVHRTVTRLRGSLHVEEVPSGGTRFVMHLPLTLVVVPALIFESADELLALSVADLETTLRNPPRRLAGAAEVIEHRGELLPVVDLASLFRWNGVRTHVSEGAGRESFVLVVRRGSRAGALAADLLIEQRDIVVKAIPSFLGQPRAISGATVAPNGRVALLLDPVALIDLSLQSHRRSARAG